MYWNAIANVKSDWAPRHVLCYQSTCYQFKISLTFRKVDRSGDCHCSGHWLEWHKTRFCYTLTDSSETVWHGSLLTWLAVTHARGMKFAFSQRRGNRKRGFPVAFLFQIVCFTFDGFLSHEWIHAESGWILHVGLCCSVCPLTEKMCLLFLKGIRPAWFIRTGNWKRAFIDMICSFTCYYLRSLKIINIVDYSQSSFVNKGY